VNRSAAAVSARIDTLNYSGKHYEELMFRRARLSKVSAPFDDLHHLLNPVSSSQASQTSETTKSAAPKPQPAQQQSTAQPSDKVTLKSSGDVNHDGDSK
jgi:hypothetical protein